MNKPLLVLGISLLTLSSPFISKADTSDNIKVTTSAAYTAKDNIPIVVSNGAEIQLTLPSNVTTGYKWQAKLPQNSVVKLKGSVYNNPDNPKGMVGMGGSETFTFTAVKVGKSKIVLEYGRPWEKNKPAKTQTFNIVATK